MRKRIFTDKNNKKEFKPYCKVRDHCHYTGKFRGAAHSSCNLRYKMPKEIPIEFHNGSTYDYHFIIKQLAKEFKGNFDSLGENTEKYITFSAPTKKELENDKANIYKLKFIDSFRFMSTSLSRLVDNLSEINKNESTNGFMLASLSGLADDLSEINKKEPTNEFIDNFRIMLASLLSHVDNLSDINKKESDINRKESTNEFINNFRIMITTLSSHIDNLSEINEKESEINKKESVNELKIS